MLHGKGISAKNRQVLVRLHRETLGPFGAQQAASTLSITLPKARRKLAYFAAQGWLTRITTGLYLTVPLDAADPTDWREDPWVVATRLFSPGYVGGWSACEHWGLTDQLFNEIVVISSRNLRVRSPQVQGTRFRLKVVPQDKIFGTTSVWRRDIKVKVSDPSRTILDILADPSLGAGLSHVAEVVHAYFESEQRDDAQIVEYAHRLRAGAAMKRLGYLLELFHIEATDLLLACRAQLTTGLIRLDPALPAHGRVITRWNLRANVPSLLPGDT